MLERNTDTWRTKISLSSVQGTAISKGKRRMAKPLETWICYYSTWSYAAPAHICLWLQDQEGQRITWQNCSQTTCGQTFVFRHVQQNWQGREWSQSVPLTMWVFTGTNLSVTQSFPPINWWQKASPTSSATQVSSSGGWTTENVISWALFLTAWVGSHQCLQASAHWGSIGRGRTSKDGRGWDGVVGLAIVKMGDGT